jgi:hypothetical protein
MLSARRRLAAHLGVSALCLAAVAVLAGAASPRSEASSAQSPANLLRSASRNSGGWRPHRAFVNVVHRSVRDTVILVRRRSSRRAYWIYRSPRPVLSTRKGERYIARAWVRTGSRRQQVCLVLREVGAQPSARAARRCLRASHRWRLVPRVRMRMRGSGHQLGLVLVGLGGRSFRVRGLYLAKAPTGKQSPIASAERWFAADSPLNTPIPSGAAVDPNSRAMVAGLLASARAKGWNVAVKRWAVNVYYADRSTPRRDVRLTASWRAADRMLSVPIPFRARPDPGSGGDTDGHMAVIDRDTHCFYEFYEARRHADGSWEAAWANRGSMNGSGIQPKGLSTRASGFVNFAGLIRPEELRRGTIQHALTFSYDFTKAGGPVLPATASDGRPATEGARPFGTLALPEGGRVQLDPNLDLASLGLSRWQTIVARALQVYGMYLADTGGGLALTAVNPQSFGRNPYAAFWGDGPYASLPTSLARHLRVLKLGPQRRSPTAVVPSSCATLD